MTRRRSWLLVHRVNGLLLAVFLTVEGLTGSLLAWKVQLERISAPQLFVLPHHDEQAARLNPMLVRKNVAAAFPLTDVDALDLSAAPDAPLEFYLTPKAGAERLTDDDAFADPYSGRVLGGRRYGDIRQGWKNFLPFVYTLHEELALGEFGATLLGVAALLWTLDCFVGMYLSFPANRRRATRSLSARAVRWPARWSASWKIRWNAGSFKRLYDLHRASGVWLWAMLLVFAWTGVAFNLPGVYRPVMHVFGSENLSRQSLSACGAGALPTGDLDWDKALLQARDGMQQRSQERGFRILSERFLSYDRANCRWTYRVRSTLDVDRIGNTQLLWDNDDVTRAIFTAPTGGAKADTFTTWIEAMHESQIGGLGFRLLVCLTGLVIALLSVTGVWIFLKKTVRRSLPAAKV